MAFNTLVVMLTLSLGATSILLFVAARVSDSPHRDSSAAVPATANVLQAWLAVAWRPSRRNIAAWARAADRSWVVVSLVVGEALLLVYGAASFIHATIWPRPLPKGEHYLFGTPSPLGRIYYALDLAPILSFITLVAVAYAVARVMPPSDETAAARFQRVLTPYALAQVPLSAATLILNALDYIPQPMFQPHTIQPLMAVTGALTLGGRSTCSC
jgi:hypothetical protein